MLDICFSDAIYRAKELDAYYKRNGKVIGPLHGLPVTFKDQFHIKGRETTLGYVGWVGTFEGCKDDPNKGAVESELIGELVRLGAIPIGKVRENRPLTGSTY
jgi:amidase